MEITIPHNFIPRDYQEALYNSVADGYKRAVACWHRRAGKDKTVLNIMVKEAFKRVGAYYYFLPTYSQGKKIIWNGMDRDGFAFLRHIPEEVRTNTLQNEMLVSLVNGSIFQVIGSDNINSIVGTNPVGCVFSEYSLQDPRGWDFVRPILRENGGWAIFIYTPRGHNHGYKLYKDNKDNPEWFCELLTIDDTGALTEADIDAERRSGMDEDLILQEFFCSFEAAMPGAYYAQQMRAVKDEGRICDVPYDPILPVNTYWDLGIGDATVIWFIQVANNQYRCIDYYEQTGEPLSHYVQVLNKKPYTYGGHVAPHDIKVRELGTGKSRLEVAHELGIDFEIAPNLRVEDGIDAVRRILSLCWFDKTKCDRGIDGLLSYRKDYDDKNQTFRLRPVHDWASHGADAFRYFAVTVGRQDWMFDPLDLSKCVAN